MKTGISFVKEIRHLLTANDPNALYVFICSLSSVEPKLWAGTTPEFPAVLEEWEVERIMKLLDCEDRLIRKQVSGSLSYPLMPSLNADSQDVTNTMESRPEHC